MIYKQLGKADARISVIAMGGHEYLPTGASRGFNENFELAVTPGYIFDGFGQENRKNVLRAAFDNGINLFDVTHDSEKEALGRNLKEMPPPYEIYVQTRPEGMVYTYDPYNAKMADYGLLKAEAQRILKLLRRETIDFFNLAFMRDALDHDPDYLAKIGDNVARLKREGLIRFACADTFSGEDTYLRQIEAGCFDVVYINYNFGDYGCERKVFPAAQAKGLGIISREAFMKGKLFAMVAEAGLTDRNRAAQAALRWNLARPETTAVVLGTGKVNHLLNSMEILENLELGPEDLEIIEQIKGTPTYREYEAAKLQEFLEDAR